MKKFAATLLLAAGIVTVGAAAPAAAAPLNSGTQVVSPFSYWPNPR